MEKRAVHSVTSPTRRDVWIWGILAALAALTTLAGCPPSPDCVQLGCDPGLVCDESSGRCVAPESDCTETGCEEGEFCDEQSGECRRRTGPCPEQPCGSGYVCNSRTGYCETRAACAEGECTSPAETCDPTTGECVPRTCQRDDGCPNGFVCGDQNQCVSGCRVGAERCPTGTFCRRVSGSDTGECLAGCDADTECPHGEICTGSDGETVCQPEPPCSVDADCRPDEVCRNRRCRAPPCTSDDDCNGSRRCDRATGVCLGEDCREDAFAPNGRPDEASWLDAGTYTELSICRGRSDWFRVDADSGDFLRLRLEHATETDVDLVVYDRHMRRIAFDQQAPPPRSGRFGSSVGFRSTRSQTLLVEVYSVGRRETERPGAQPLPLPATYTLSIEVDDNRSCEDDEAEENDQRTEARQLPTAFSTTGFSYTSCGRDADWFEFSGVPSDAQFNAELIGAPSSHRFHVLSPDGHRFERSGDDTFGLVRTGVSGDWYVAVRPNDSRETSYRLQYAFESGFACPERGEHGNLESALSLPAGPELEYELCPVEEGWESDWFELDSPNTTSQIDLTLQNTGALPEVDVTLFDRQQEGVRLVRRANPSDGTYRLVAEIDADSEPFLRVSSDEPLGRLTRRPSYTVSYTLTPN